MAPSQPIWISPVVEASQELENYLESAEMIEKLFLRSFSKDKVDTTEFEHTDLHKYYHLRLEQSPREAGQFWLQHMTDANYNDPCVQALCKYRVPLDYYKIKGSKGPLVTSRGEMEENHIKLWMTKLEKKFIPRNQGNGVRKLSYDRVIRDYFELSVILKRCLEEATVTLKFKILNSLVRRLNAVDVFLLKEVCAANAKYGHPAASFKNRKEVYEMSLFILAAELMFKRLRNTVCKEIPQRRNGYAGEPMGDGDEELYAYSIQGAFAITTSPTLTTSESPSTSTEEVDNVVTYHY